MPASGRLQTMRPHVQRNDLSIAFTQISELSSELDHVIYRLPWMSGSQDEATRIFAITNDDLVNDVFNQFAVGANDANELDSVDEEMLHKSVELHAVTVWAMKNYLRRICHNWPE